MEENAPSPEKQDKTTLKDVGKGFMLLGTGILLFTVVFFLMAIWENDYYGLFAGETHLKFDLGLGLLFLIIGALLFKARSRAEAPKDENPHTIINDNPIL